MVIGGGSDQDQGLARELIPAIRFSELPSVMERLFAAYTSDAQSGRILSRIQPPAQHRRVAIVLRSKGVRVAMSTTVPFIPDNAPFTSEQRAWLNGMLAGMFSSASLPAHQAKPSHRIAVLYASQSGTAEGLARKLAKELKAQGHMPAVSTLVGYTPAALAAEKICHLPCQHLWRGRSTGRRPALLRRTLPGTLPPLRRPLLCRLRLGRQPLRTLLQVRPRPRLETRSPRRQSASPTASIAMLMSMGHSRNGRLSCSLASMTSLQETKLPQLCRSQACIRRILLKN